MLLMHLLLSACGRYAFFGTTVRTATRIAHGGFPMTVHVSEDFVNSMGPDRKTDFVVYAKQCVACISVLAFAVVLVFCLF